MKRSWTATAAAAMLAGCSSTQPATNPFLRTTVPPPATGQGAIVVPGEPYTPGVAPAVPYTPGQAAPAAVTPVVPVAPPYAAPPPAAAPPVIPPRDKYAPPGGSYQYNQSSLNRPSGVRQASNSSTGADSGAVQQAVVWEHQPSDASPASFAGSQPSTSEIAAGGGDETPAQSDEDYDSSTGPANTIRIVGPATAELAEQTAESEVEPSDDSPPVLRITAGEDTPRATSDSGFRETSRHVAGQPEADVVIVSPGNEIAAGLDEDSSAGSAAQVHTVHRPIESGEALVAPFGQASDYAWLLGRLEYSHSLRQ